MFAYTGLVFQAGLEKATGMTVRQQPASTKERSPDEVRAALARRTFLGRSACGIGAAALASLLSRTSGHAADNRDRAAAASRGVINPLHTAPKARRIIFLTMAGGPSHLE